jgi:DNA polymerase V
MFALVDGNTFFASCERVFRPDLRHAPVVVLSNNDGCVVAASPEAKALKIPMGIAFFKVEKFCEQQGVAVFSSNYELYGDLSARMMKTIAGMTPSIEVYSIDECFADVSGIRDCVALGAEIKRRVWQWVGIPVCVGIAPTKTLAKFANHLAKKNPEFRGVCDWNRIGRAAREGWMKRYSASEIWGVGRRMSAKLAEMNIRSVFDFYRADAALIRSRFSVMAERTLRELRGAPSIEISDIASERQQILRSRSFGAAVTSQKELLAALSYHLETAAQELRAQKSFAGAVGVFFSSSRFRDDVPGYSAWDVVPLSRPTADTARLAAATRWLLRRLYRDGIEYKRAGVVLMDLSGGEAQQDLFAGCDSPKRLALMRTLDGINERFGRHAIYGGVQNIGAGWRMRRERMSPRYTTRWSEMLKVA